MALLGGSDAGFDWALLVSGHSDAALGEIAESELAGERLAARGATAADTGGLSAAVHAHRPRHPRLSVTISGFPFPGTKG